MTIYIFIGPPGSGKSTQAKLMVQQCQAHYFASGERLRKAVEKKDSVGQEIENYQDKGELVPDQLVDQLVDNFFTQEYRGQHDVVFDGYPRNLAELEYLEKIAKQSDLTIIGVNIALSDTSASRRLIDRAKNEDSRDDDNEAVIAHRLEIYHQETEPLLKALANRHSLKSVDGELAIDQVFNDLQGKLSHAA